MTSQIPDFIQIAEANFNRELRTLQQEKIVAYTISSEYQAAPNDFGGGVRAFRVTTPPAHSLQYLPNELQTDWYSVNNLNSLDDGTLAAAGTPRYFSVQGMNFRFAPVPTAPVDAVLQYYQSLPALALNATNWLLTAHPDLYLLGSILGAALYIHDDPRLGMIQGAYDRIMDSLKRSDDSTRYGGGAMATRAA